MPIADGDSAYEVQQHDRRVVGGVIARLAGDWSAGLDYTWHRSRLFYRQPGGLTPETVAAIQNGSLDVLTDLNAFPLNASLTPITTLSEPAYSTLRDATLRGAGSVWQMPGGAVSLSALLEYRDERYDETTSILSGVPVTFFPGRMQTVKSAYVETRLPFFSEPNARTGVRELELQLAGRHDRYEVNGVTGFVNLAAPPPIVHRTNRTNSTDYTVGLRYAPVRDVVFRTSFGTGFQPPSMNQLISNPNSDNAATLFDPRRGGQPLGASGTRVPTLTGGNAGLEPEESESWSAGLILTPRFIPGLRLSLDYVETEKTDNITFLSSQTLLDNESFFPGRVTRAASCPGDLFEPVCPVTFLDTTSVNIARAKLEALDLQLDYSLPTQRFGTFDFYAVGTRQFHFETQLFPTSAIIENVGINATISVPLKFKANAGLTWSYHNWTLGWSARYFDSYLAALPSQTGSALTLANQLGLKNMFDTRPPFDASNTAYYYSRLGDPRLRSYYLALKKSF